MFRGVSGSSIGTLKPLNWVHRRQPLGKLYASSVLFFQFELLGGFGKYNRDPFCFYFNNSATRLWCCIWGGEILANWRNAKWRNWFLVQLKVKWRNLKWCNWCRTGVTGSGVTDVGLAQLFLRPSKATGVPISSHIWVASTTFKQP